MVDYLKECLKEPVPREWSFPESEYRARLAKTRQAMDEAGIDVLLVQDNFCVCMPSRINDETGKMEITATKARPGDYVGFYSEIDLLVAVSVCPMGDGSFAATTPEKVTVRPVGVEILDTGIGPREFPKRYDWRPHWQGQWNPDLGSGS